MLKIFRYNDIMEEIDQVKETEKAKFTKTKSQQFFDKNLEDTRIQRFGQSTQRLIAQLHNPNIKTANYVGSAINSIINKVYRHIQISEFIKAHSISQTLDVIVNRQNFYQQPNQQPSLIRHKIKVDFQPQPLPHLGQPKLQIGQAKIDDKNLKEAKIKKIKANEATKLNNKKKQGKMIEFNKVQLLSTNRNTNKKKQIQKLTLNISQNSKLLPTKSISHIDVQGKLIGLSHIYQQQQQDDEIETLRRFKLVYDKENQPKKQSVVQILKQPLLSKRKSSQSSGKQLQNSSYADFMLPLKKHQLIQNCVGTSKQDKVLRNFYSFAQPQYKDEMRQRNKTDCEQNERKINRNKVKRKTLETEQQEKQNFHLPFIQISKKPRKSDTKMLNSISEWCESRYLKQHKFRLDQLINSNSMLASIKMKKVTEIDKPDFNQEA